jgi:hypothetical protein
MAETAITIPAPPPPPAAHPVHWWHKASGFSFHDVLDTLNPLQHIPIVGSIYRSITHDEPGAVARILGDGLYGGGPIGALVGLFTGALNVLVQADTGKDIGEHMLSLVGLGGHGASSGTANAGGTAAPPANGTGQGPMPLSPTRYVLPTGAPSTGAAGGQSPNIPADVGAAGTTAAASPAAASPAASRPLGPSLSQRPVPLRASGLLLPGAHSHPLPPAPGSTAFVAAAATPAAPGAAATPATPAPPAGGAVATPGPDQPIEISEKMSEALDKYARIMQQRQGKPTGSRVDVVQ